MKQRNHPSVYFWKEPKLTSEHENGRAEFWAFSNACYRSLNVVYLNKSNIFGTFYDLKEQYKYGQCWICKVNIPEVYNYPAR